MLLNEFLLLESVTQISNSDFTIEDLGENKYKIKSNATAGPAVAVINSLSNFLTFAKDMHAEKSPFGDMTKAFKKAKAKITNVLTAMGKPIDVRKRFSGSSIIFEGDKAAIESILAAAIAFQNSEIKAKQERIDSAPARKKAAAKFSAAKQKERVGNLEAKYGKNTIGRVKIKQIGGDDGYQWNVIVDGKSIMNGLTKREAEHEQEQAWARIAKREKTGTFGQGM